METRPRTIPLDSVDAYNRLYGLETLHPLVAVIDLKKAKDPVNHILMDYGVYALYLIKARTVRKCIEETQRILRSWQRQGWGAHCRLFCRQRKPHAGIFR